MGLSGVGVVTTGDRANGLFNGDGGSLSLSLGSVTTQGVQADAVYAAGGSTTSLTNVTISTSGAGSKGLDVSGSGTSLTGAGLTITTAATIDPASGAFSQGVYNGATGGGGVTLDRSAITTSGAFAIGLQTDNGGVTRFTGGSIVTYTADTAALSASGAGTSVTVAPDSAGGLTSVTTYGQRSPGVIAASGASVAISGAQITTGNSGAAGLTLSGAATVVKASDLVIATSGGFDYASLQGANAVNNGPSFTDSVGGTLTLTRVKATASGDGVYALYTGAGGVTTVTQGQYVATGVGSAAIAAVNGGSVQIASAYAGTSGDGGFGLQVSGAGSQLKADSVAVSTSGGASASGGSPAIGVFNGPSGSYASGGAVTLSNSTVTTTGDYAHAIFTGAGGSTTLQSTQATAAGAGAVALVSYNGGQTTVAGGFFIASGTDGAAAALVNGGSLQIQGATLAASGDGGIGLLLSGTGGQVALTGVSLSTTGGLSGDSGAAAFGVYNALVPAAAADPSPTLTGTRIATSGVDAIGLYTGSGSTTSMRGGGITTQGDNAVGAFANGGQIVLAADSAGNRLSISTSGAVALGVAVLSGEATLSGTDIATSGVAAPGLGVSGVGAVVSATGVTIRTQGGAYSTGVGAAYGVYNGPGFGSGVGGTLTASGLGVTTAGTGATALFTGAGGVTQATGSTFRTSGSAAYGVDAMDGGAVTLADSSVTTTGAGAHGVHVGAGSSVAFAGATTIAVSAADATGLYVEAGGTATAKSGALTVTAAGNGVYLKGDSTGAAALTLGSTLNLTTTGAGGAALTLDGAGVSFTASQGGAITVAGTAIALLNGAGQSASFANFNIQSLSGDLIFSDPATSTVSFSNTTANAGTGNLANVANNSQLTLTADASTLTGAILTGSGSTSNVTLNNGTSWTIAGNSTITNLTINNSSAIFAPSSGFMTLTAANYTGNNALITLNAALNGSGGSDQIVINGGTASGSTTIALRTTGTPTAAFKLPLVVATNGGTISPTAFSLAAPFTVGGFSYALQYQNNGEYLVSSQVLSPTQASGSLASVAQSRQAQAVTSRVLGSILTGATEQINCSSCSSGFASFGSFALGVHGRWTLNQNVSLLAGLSYDNFNGRGVTVNNALLGALGLRYDAVQLGKYRPFAEAGLAVEPWSSVTYRRSYLTALGESVGVGTALSRSATAYGRAGYIWRLTRADEAAVYTSLSRSWTWTSGYTEGASAANPFGASLAPTLDRMNVWSVGAQFTHLFGEHIEGNVSAGYARAFGASFGSSAAITGYGDASAMAPTGFDWVELGGRVSYRFSKTFIADAFVLGTLGAQPAGNQIHGGVALRMAF